MMHIDILFQDKWIVVLEKPSGILTVPFQGSSSKTVASVLEEIMRKNGTYSAKHKPFAVHRLDRDTSGVMMFALTDLAHKKIMDSWQTMVKERLYVAVAENPKTENNFHYAKGDRKQSTPQVATLPDSGVIDDDISYNAYNRGYVKKDFHHNNQKTEKQKTVTARTYYKIILRGKTHSLFELSLDTGRKNQIRAHLASRGYVIAGDKNYNAKTNPFNRLALHAKSLIFTHPFTGEEMSFEIDAPAEWIKFVK